MTDRLETNSDMLYDKSKNLCIWMTAGVISYKLCPFNYDCDNCDFDQIMRWQEPPKQDDDRLSSFD